MAINTIADIVARGPVRRVYTFDANGQLSTLVSALQFYLKKFGWSGAGNEWTSRSIANHAGYEQCVKITWTELAGAELRITINDAINSFGTLETIRLKPVVGVVYIMGGPFQVIMVPSGISTSDISGLLVSTLNLPDFSTHKNCIVGMELMPFLRNYATIDSSHYFAGFIDSAGGAVYINPVGGSGAPGTISLPGYSAKVIFNWFGPFGVKSSAWLQWGSGAVTDTPTLKGFLWDTFLWYDSRYTGKLERIVIDSRASLQLANVGNNIFVFEYGQVAQP